MNIDQHNMVAQSRKRSSLKHNNIFPEGMSYEEFMASKQKKLQWDNKAEEIEKVDDAKNLTKDVYYY